ncbi:substrate-binding domain-containing protein [Paenibacillus thermoaerophilus]|uniref:Substrate-binding domain-containing protein n=1 Tax=Paenibacillus thermoaerophilus TaxID=1215385 RepID=A0ABW2V2D1_9BACL|nr:substrate-binding domain-containing protein [Paenibacillus thermoaerophilus]TMV18275.1 substrate-binding domain-containing protein [Paenibacillus thermoaerophilus]
MRRTSYAAIALWLVFSLSLAACGSAAGGAGNTADAGSSAQNNLAADGPTAASGGSEGPIAINQALPDKEILSKGPDGESAVSAKTLQLTDEELAKIKAGRYKAAVSMHYAGNDWSAAQLKGLQDTFAKMNIEIVATTDANFKAETQVANIETILAKKPDILVGIPVDAVSTASVFKKAASQGVKIVFMDNKAAGLEAGKDYVSVVSADNYGNGVEAAHILAKAVGGEGEVGVIFHDADFFVTKQRTEAFENTIRSEYPNIKIIARGGITGPNDGEKVAAAMLTKHPNLKGLFVVWDVPAEGALAAARSAGRTDLAVATIDLGMNVALDIAKGGMMKGLGAQLPYDQGVAEAILAAYALLGKETPPYVAVPSLQVNRDNILESWKTVYHSDAPASLRDAAK